jgi:hypothetical protein
MTIFEFAKLKPSQKEEIIHTKAMLIESYVDKEIRVTLYYMPSFFIEVITCLKQNAVLDVIPFRRGFKFEQVGDKMYYNQNRFLLVAC